MYASFSNQFYEMIHYAFSALLLLVVWPAVLFRGVRRGDANERIAARMMRAVLLYIVLGYALVLLKLFEVLAIVTVLLLLSFRDLLRREAAGKRLSLKTSLGLLFYETLDFGFRFRQRFENIRQTIKQRLKKRWGPEQSPEARWPRLLLLLVLLGAAYLRFYDAWTSPTPAMSDGYVTLAWMKYIDERVLFHDGIYPQGFHILLDYLHKFAAIDPLYILKYTGPLDGVLITFGLYFATSRWTGNRYAGIAATVLYGLAGIPMHGGDWIRQAATNSQEFAMVFAFPSLYFLARFWRDGEKQDLWSGASGLMIIGLVHSLIFGWLGMGLAVILFVGLFIKQDGKGKRLWPLIQVEIASVLLALVPLGIGRLLGKDVHSNSEDFLTSKVYVTPPSLQIYDFAALTGIVIACLCLLIVRKPVREKAFDLNVLLFVFATFVLYEFGAAVTHSSLLYTRGPSLWAMAIPVSVGLGLHALLQIIRSPRLRGGVQAVLCIALTCVQVLQTHFQPIEPYKTEWDAEVEQYLKIASQYRPQTWTFVTDHNEGYDIVLGSGYHMFLEQMLAQYDPKLPALTKFGANEPDPNVSDDIFIVQEKQVFEVSKQNVIYSIYAPEYTARKKQNKQLATWIATYEAHHYAVHIYYEDAQIRIYHLQKPKNLDEQQTEIWGAPKS